MSATLVQLFLAILVGTPVVEAEHFFSGGLTLPTLGYTPWLIVTFSPGFIAPPLRQHPTLTC